MSCCEPTVTAPGPAQPHRPAGPDVAGEAQRGPQPQPQPAQRDQQAQRQHHHAERWCRADRTSSPAPVSPPRPVPRPVDQGVGQVGAHHGDAGQQRGDDRPGEPVVRLQHPGQHDAEAVERQLGGEHPQHPGADVLGVGRHVRAAARRSGRRAARRATASGTSSASVQVSSAEVTAVDPRRVPGRDRPGQQRHDQAGQRTPGDDLEDDVRDGVGGDVDVAERVVARRSR